MQLDNCLLIDGCVVKVTELELLLCQMHKAFIWRSYDVHEKLFVVL